MTKWAPPHHIHALAHAVVTAILIPAVGSQLYPRVRRIVGLQILLLVALGGLVVSLIAMRGVSDLDFPVFNFTLYSIVGLLILFLHPERGRIFEHGRVSPGLALLAVAGLIPLTGYAVAEIGKQWSGFEPFHGGHWALMAATAVVLIVVAGLGAIAGEGRRLAIWTAGLGAGLLGLGSLAFPSEASTFGIVGGLMALLWGSAFIALGEFGRSRLPADLRTIRAT